MFNLTLNEQLLVVAILVAVVTGVAVKHWRDGHRELPSALVAAPSPVRR